MIYLMQTPDIQLIAETVDSLGFADSLIVIIIVLCFIIFGLVGVILYQNRSSNRKDELDNTFLGNQQENFFDLMRTFVENSTEDRILFKSAIEEFSISNKLQQDGNLKIQKHLELIDSANAQRTERLREVVETESLKIQKLIKEDKNG